MSTSHAESFDVITSRDGGSELRFRLTCATAAEHYARTTHTAAAPSRVTASTSCDASRDEPPCSTGLRVYEGAHVLAALLVHFGQALCDSTTDPAARRWVLELGCGCGLGGFTAAEVYRTATVVFTDAATDCLALVRDSAAHMDCRVKDATGDAELAWGAARVHYTFPLHWSDDGVTALLDAVRRHTPSATSPVLDLVIGSDIMYHRVDLLVLLTTCKQLLERGAAASAVSPLVVLCHFMRIPDGRARLARQARALDLGIVAVPLTAFLDKDVVRTRGWGGVEAVLLFRPPSSSLRAAAVTRTAEHDVQLLRTRLLHAAPTRATTAELADCLAPYPGTTPSTAHACGAQSQQEAEAMELMRMLA